MWCGFPQSQVTGLQQMRKSLLSSAPSCMQMAPWGHQLVQMHQLVHFWDGTSWKSEHETTLITKAKTKQNILYCCLFTNAEVSRGLQLRLQFPFLTESKAEPVQHSATSTHLSLWDNLVKVTVHPWTVASGHWAAGQISASKLFNQKTTQTTKDLLAGLEQVTDFTCNQIKVMLVSKWDLTCF